MKDSHCFVCSKLKFLFTLLSAIFLLVVFCRCDKEKEESEINKNLFEEPINEWGISTDVLKSKVKYPVSNESHGNVTFLLKLNGIELIGNKYSILEYQNIDKDISCINYYFVNDDATLNAAEVIFRKSLDYYSVLDFLRNKYGIEKTNTLNGLSWLVEDTYISLSKQEDESFSVYYYDANFIFGKPKPATSISFIEKKNYSLSVGESLSLSWQVTPSNSKYKVSIKSVDPSIVMIVNETGLIRAISEGRTQIIINIDGTEICDTCNIEVTRNYTAFNFEHVKHGGNVGYDIFCETDGNGNNIMDWASGNPGFAFSDMSAPRENYPTVSSDNGYKGKCAMLVTRSTGDFGSEVGMPIASGNLFLGSFDMLNAITDALKATKFGIPFDYVPTRLTGYYKYKAGPKFSESGQIMQGKKDIFDIYAIFYETSETVKTLDGTNKFTHPNLVSIARIEDAKETAEWTQFNLPFKTLPGKTIDMTKLNAGQYNVAIVFSSSIEGDVFNGAVGSTLYIDEVELITE